VLARDLTTYTITLVAREMKDRRATARRIAKVLRLDLRKLERDLAHRPWHHVVARQVDPHRGLEIAALGLRGVHVTAATRRDYPLGAAATEILGRCNIDHVGVDGLELQLDDELRGRAGWTTQLRFAAGRGRTHAIEHGLKRAPEDGRTVVVTIDAGLQAIVEGHLARAVDSLDAVRGFALFLDPRTGEVLASANVPHLGPGKARNWNFTDQFEPGSTFKIVAAGAALEEGLARPDQVFEAAESGQALLAPGAVIHDVHKEARFTFRDAIRWSSNIVAGKLGLLLGEDRLYRYCTRLGFGSLTGVAFPGETGGKLRSPAQWSARSAPTIAIGHELAVTPIQLALAYAAVANGGILMEPMLVREIREPDGTVARRMAPRAVQRVFSARTTELLRDMLAAVVDSGTAKAARVTRLAIAGKTGTAQKYDAKSGGYGKGMYVSSFAGFAPARDPAIVGVVVIDEPRGKKYYGGEVAAPVFREILLDLRRLRGDFGSGAERTVLPPPSPAPVVVPDVRLLPADAAERRLAAVGLRARFAGAGARALGQEPPAGAAAERGDAVIVRLAPPPDSTGRALPDVAGLSVREALRRLTAVSVRAKIEHGTGVVVRQEPPPGTALPMSKPCRLWLAPGLGGLAARPAAGGS
jgi:cell division protein FtsI/penicillin-binding protein 2